MKKQYKIVNTLRFFAFILISVLIIAFAGTSFFKLNQASATSVNVYKQIEIQKGDTLWEVAENFCSDEMDIRLYIDEICETNDITPESVKAGDIIFIPIYDL